MTWWITLHSRLISEKAAISHLESSVDWLVVNTWKAKSELNMCIDFQVSHGGKVFEFEMVYPSVFPDAPTMVFTKDSVLISTHQYGAGGEICLEYRPDNWQSGVTGAMMIESLKRLLEAERLEDGSIQVAHSSHVESLGRDLRSKHFRFLLTGSDYAALNTLENCVVLNCQFTNQVIAAVFVSAISFIGGKDDPVWQSDLIQPNTTTGVSGYVVRVENLGLLGEVDKDKLVEILNSQNLKSLADLLFNNETFLHLLIGNGAEWEFFCIYGQANDRKVVRYTSIEVPSSQPRLSMNYHTLTEKLVGIVGCGSVGSKIGASLVRSGVCNFFLVDDDIFFPGNVVRNELDLTYIGMHKTKALGDRLCKINPSVNVRSLEMALGGQESSKSMTGALEALGSCDILVDATANPSAFNLIASVATRKQKPMVWVEVFAGGVGGIVARARPEIDPIPLIARAQIETWCSDQGIEWNNPPNLGAYQMAMGDEDPLIADDAEVSLMAAHATRFISDILIKPDSSIFPVSAYAVGCTSKWAFNEPFHTWPIELILEGSWGEVEDPIAPEEMIKLIEEHIVTE